MRRLFTFFSIAAIMVSCGPTQKEYDELLAQKLEYETEAQQEYDKLLAQKQELETEVSNLKQIIDNYENTPDRLYSEAEKLIVSKDIEGLTVLCSKFDKYHPASSECKKAKGELKKLIDAKEEAEKAEKAKRMKAVNKLIKKYDDISGITWYYNPYFTHYNNKNLTSIYIGKQGSSVWLRLKMSYEGDNWIFFEDAYLSYDENTKYIPFDEYKEKKSDNGYGGYVWEWIDVPVDYSLLSYLKNMVNGKTLKMRLSGKYTHTRTLTADEKAALQDVLLAYDVLENGE